MSESNLADDLRPHMQGVSRRSPVVDPQAGPRVGKLSHSVITPRFGATRHQGCLVNYLPVLRARRKVFHATQSFMRTAVVGCGLDVSVLAGVIAVVAK